MSLETNPIFGVGIEQQQQLCSLIIDSLDTSVAVYIGPELKLVYANPAALERTDIDIPHLINKSIKEFYPQFKHYIGVLQEVMSSGKPIQLREYQYSFGEKYDKWWNILITPYKIGSDIVGVFSLANDITEQVMARNKVKELAEKLEEKVVELNTVVDSLPVGVIFIDEYKNVAYINKHVTDNFKNHFRGYKVPFPLEPFVEKISPYITDKNYKSLRPGAISSLLEGKIVLDQIIITLQSKTPKKIFARVSPAVIKDKNGNIKGCTLIIQDDTERIINEKTISEQRNILKNIFEQIPLGLALYKHPDMTVFDANDAFLNLTSSLRKMENIIGLKQADFISNWQRVKHLWPFQNNPELLKQNLSSAMHFPLPTGDKYLDIYSYPIIEDEEIKYWLEIIHDITQQVNYTKNIEELSKIKEEFFANVSHEFKTPLTVILGTLQLVSKKHFHDNLNPEISVEYGKSMQIIRQNCYRLLRLINNLLDITRLNSGHLILDLYNCNIVELVEEVTLSIVPFAEQCGIELVFDTDLEEKIITIDINKIEKVILNLLSNAIKFTDKGGTVSVHVKNSADKVRISIKDTGIGIPKDKLDKIFDRFVQVDNFMNRRHEGSGIGLSLSKSFVELHNGTITVSSSMKTGSEFVVELPNITIPDKETIKTLKENWLYKPLHSKDIEFSDITFIP